MNRTIYLNPVEPASLSGRHPLGVNLELNLKILDQRGVPVDPSGSLLALLPRSRGSVHPYDVEVLDPVNGTGRVEVHGSALTDVSGYTMELYSRTGSPTRPTGLLAKGLLAMEGSAYSGDEAALIIVPPVVEGPPGPPGPTGTRGSLWFTGNGDPSPGAFSTLEGDMYLDEDTGNVWRYANGSWVLGAG